MQNLHKIAVFGISGSQGGSVASALMKVPSFKIIGITRNSQKKELEHFKKQGVEVRQADMNDTRTLTNVLRDVDAVFSVQSFFELFSKEREIEQGKNVIHAAKEVGVKYFVYTSVGGADRKSGLNHFDSKWAIEEHLRSSGLHYSILRPAFFMENFKTMFKAEILTKGTLTLPFSPDRKLQMIAVKDIGEFARICFSSPTHWDHKEIEIAGDELNMKKIVEVLGKSLGKDITYQQELNESKFPKEFYDMFQWFEKAGFQSDLHKMREIWPHTLTFEKWIHEFPFLEK